MFAESNPGLWAFGTHCRVWTFGWDFFGSLCMAHGLFAGRCIFGIKKKLRQGDLAWPTGPTAPSKNPWKTVFFLENYTTTRLPENPKKWGPLISC